MQSSNHENHSSDKGYKQTEVGLIPEDWESSQLGDFSYVTKLAGFEYTIHFDYSKSGPVIAVRALNIKNGTLDLAEVHTIPKKTSDDLPRSKLTKGDLVISYVGTLGRVAMIPEDNKFHLAPNVAKICVDKTQVAPEFLAQFLNSFNGQKLIFDAAASTTQAALSMRSLRGISFVRPPLPEQRAIAAALSDVDALLGGLDQLIAKKRDLKQAAMQQLLTGQTRLPGFYGEWKPRKFAELLKYGRPDEFLVNSTEYLEQGDTPVLTANKSFVLGYTNDEFGIYQNLPAIIFDDFTTDCKYVNFPFKVKSSAIKILKARSADVNLRFIYSRMRLVNFPLGEHKRYYISEYQHIELPTPEPDEQTAISAVLSDMDVELAALEARRDKTRDLKQAMMQELLTGKTRLVPIGDAHD